MTITFEYDSDFIESDSCNRFIGPKDMNYFEDFFLFLVLHGMWDLSSPTRD